MNTVHAMSLGGTALLLLAGCGDSPDRSSGAEAGGTDAAAVTQAARQEDRPAPSRSCPPQLASEPRAEGAPVDDIVGIRPGMGFDDVVRILECRDDVSVVETAEKWNLQQTYGFPLRQVVRASNGAECTGREIAGDMGSVGRQTCNDGGYRFKPLKGITREFDVVFTGMPGEEKVGALWRRNEYAEGEQPTIDSLAQSLADKYGAPHVTEKDRQGRTHLTWLQDLLGRPISQASADFNTCKSMSFNASFAASHAWRSNCGLTIKVAIAPVHGNELLAREMNMGLMHQKTFYEAGQTFERDLAAAYETRKQQEAAEAAKKGVKTDF